MKISTLAQPKIRFSKSAIRIFRPLNLVIVALTQWLTAAAIIWPAYRGAGVWWSVGPFFLIKIIAATVLTAASGYVVNDLFDEKTDSINRPFRQIVGQLVSKKTTGWIYISLIISVLAMTGLIFRESQLTARQLNLWIFPGIAAALFFYSWLLKGTPFLGNILIALFCAAVPLLVFFQEKRPLEVLAMHRPDKAQLVRWLVFGYAFFAAATTFLREIVKDLEDLPGDRAAKLKTAPVVFGEKPVRWVAFFVAIGLFFFLIKSMSDLRTTFEKGAFFWAAGGLLLLPALFVLVKLPTAAAPSDYRRISLAVKVLMFFGLVLLAVFGPRLVG